MSKKKVVQTEITEQEYVLFQKSAKKKGLTIKQGLREAIQQWISTQIPLEEDPLFKVKPENTGVKTDSKKLDKLLYEG
jgi:hypothetical protein